MEYRKKFVATLEKCYALSKLQVNGEALLLVAAEKHSPCFLLDKSGNVLETVWEEPGGVMTMVPVPWLENTLIAVNKFYSPNDSAEAKLVCARRGAAGGWDVWDLAKLPFVHRFDILESGGTFYLLACTLKSGHEHKNDWRFPGKLLAAELGPDLTQPLQFRTVCEGLSHNHGYTRYRGEGVQTGIISCDQGVFHVVPPVRQGAAWELKQLLDRPCSDAVLIDLDQDGQPELLTISPFHGDTVAIWRRGANGAYEQAYSYPEALLFLHAIDAGTVYGRPTVYVGNREGERLFLAFYYDMEKGTYAFEEIDRGAGPANCLLFERDGLPILLAANRESDEIAMYEIYP